MSQPMNMTNEITSPAMNHELGQYMHMQQQHFGIYVYQGMEIKIISKV
jgi:hypothetical protein